MSNKNYKLFDYESGEYVEVTQKAFEAHKAWMDNFRATIPSLNAKKVGKIIITSSTPEEGDNDFKSLWENKPNQL